MAENLSIHQRANRAMWDAWAKGHPKTAFYDVAGFKSGKSSLQYVEREELGDVSGKRLLHLQCHFGMDTLSWAREGAVATGVDFSPEAIAQAKALSQEIGVPADFLRADVLALPAELEERFDIVFTSYGALCWLGDLGVWARGISRCLKPGGTFYMVEFHPFLAMIDDDGREIEYPYFGEGEPMRFVSTGSYAGVETGPHENFEWNHPVSSVINALLNAGLALEYVHEFDHSVYNCFTFFVEREPGRYALKDRPVGFPLMYSLKARKTV